VLNQGKLMDSLSKKLAFNDKILETINNRMNSFSTTIKNQLSFNKMLESQLQQLANIVPANQGKISGQPEDLQTPNLVDIGVTLSPKDGMMRLPIKKGDLGRPVIPISI
jgi:hypothetical protein